jgi:hypothetical protein
MFYVTVSAETYINNIKKIQEQLGTVMEVADNITINVFTISFSGKWHYRIIINATVSDAEQRRLVDKCLRQIQDIMEEEKE